MAMAWHEVLDDVIAAVAISAGQVSSGVASVGVLGWISSNLGGLAPW